MNSLSSNETKKQPIYYCQRCKNHGQVAPRRAHQRQCPFKHCCCGLCRLIDHRRIVMRTRNQIHMSEGMPPYARMADYRAPEEIVSEKKTRKPRCFLCSGHGKDEVLKDHKRRGCPYEHCTCSACMLGRQYRRLMAIQTKQRRDQTRDDFVQIIEVKESDAAATPPTTKLFSEYSKSAPTKKGFFIDDILAQETPRGNIAQSSASLPLVSNLPQNLCEMFSPFLFHQQTSSENGINFLLQTKYDNSVLCTL